MEYRKLPRGGEQISVIGLGNSSLSAEVGEKEIQATVEMALENGVNYFDMAPGTLPLYWLWQGLSGCGIRPTFRCISVRTTTPANMSFSLKYGENVALMFIFPQPVNLFFGSLVSTISIYTPLVMS